MNVPWHERDLEQWLLKHHKNELSGPLLFIQRHAPIRRMVDMLAIDAEQQLVLIEVKNERSSRAALGQSLEYLAHLDKISLAELDDDFRVEHPDCDLRKEYAERFGTGLSLLNDRRRVIIIGPDFDPETYVATEFLNTHIAKANFSLMCASYNEGRFTFKAFVPPATKSAHELNIGDTVEGRKGRVYVVLERTPLVLWKVGRLTDSGTLALSSGTALRQSLVCQDIVVGNVSKPFDIELDLTGSVWTRQSGLRQLQARVLGVVHSRIRKGRSVGKNLLYARFEEHQFTGFRKTTRSRFVERWKRDDTRTLPSWNDIAALASGAQAAVTA